MTTGLLAWGQAGNYNAINDRLVIRALGGVQFGLTLAPTLSAGSGLVINVGPWLAIVDCSDGTSAVIGNTSSTTVSETAGGGADRTDVIWADINPDGASWSLSVITQAAASGRTGVALGTVFVPAGTATAAGMTLTPGSLRVIPSTPQRVWRVTQQGNFGTTQTPLNWEQGSPGIASPVSGIPVLAGNYMVRGIIFAAMGSPNANQTCLLTGPAVSFMSVGFACFQGNSMYTASYITALASSLTINMTGGGSGYMQFSGLMTFSAAGTLSMAGRAPTAGSPWAAMGGSHLEAAPVV